MNISDIPPSIYVMSGSLSIALISCLSAYASVVYNKENKISDFRQEWASELRDESSQLISKLDQLSVISAAFMDKNAQSLALNSIVENKYEHILMVIKLKTEIKELTTKIRIRLNPEKLKVVGSIEEFINGKMINIESLINDFAHDYEQNKIITIGDEINNLEAKLGELIKENWKVVKSGEPAYKFAKQLTLWSSIIMFIFIVAAAIVIAVSLIKTQNLSDKNAEKSKPSTLEIVISNAPCYLPLQCCK
ncbi:hypothetical protein [Yersinia rohdei]|uniref:hypothetical protein n=1 Tax=Yersinia rohdei TaxID=29485 RepID=UPI0005E363A4|nr:hypothetical protein [Yersinia rohdei]CQJ53733.1 Uncharacterised protein [Yersinia rohdei]